ncbi:SH3 domain-containing protein [Desulfosporosinus shakirovi]|uniref:SH3 domain-containing protein n=1 Tax=Desulfosporosinus shakirovi TaxID=2885154 RepID=UPI001E31C9D7|nr:SH3 domain-containing protein [Desulfosporosinus sp. SRJS8]MCB8818097.1 SH3 domain-containing protein [Desulfosporosinus sp. SRJS8]
MKNGVKNKIAAGVFCSALLLGTTPLAMAETLASNGTDKTAAPVSSVIENSTSNPTGILSIHYHVTASVLNVRSGPGTSYSIVGQVYKGDVVWYNSELPWDVPAPWTPIYKGTLQGYVDENYIQEY